jgi:hypothetical protein
MSVFAKYLTPSLFIGTFVAVIVSVTQAVSVYNGNFETVSITAFGTVVATAAIRGAAIFLGGKFA